MKVVQLDINGKEIKTWNSVREIQRELGFHTDKIFKCLRGKRKTYKNYQWKYFEE